MNRLRKAHIERNIWATVESVETMAWCKRLLVNAVTGNQQVLSHRIWHFLGLLKNLKQNSWPFINSSILDFNNASVDFDKFPRDQEGIPFLASECALTFLGSTALKVSNFKFFYLS